jgi:hydrogenase maturation protease
MKPHVLVAGVGNIFLGDDGFGVEVVRQLETEEIPEFVAVADFGIRGVHLAYELLDGYDVLILVDAAPQGREPGTVYVIEPDLTGSATDEPLAAAAKQGQTPLIDAHGLEPDSVFALLKVLGGKVGRAIVVGCEPKYVGEHMGLSDVVEAAVDEGVRVVRELIDEEVARMQNGDAGVDRPRTKERG